LFNVICKVVNHHLIPNSAVVTENGRADKCSVFNNYTVKMTFSRPMTATAPKVYTNNRKMCVKCMISTLNLPLLSIGVTVNHVFCKTVIESFVTTKCTTFGQLILRKIIIIVAIRCQILRLKCTKSFVGGGHPRSRWGSL